MTDFAWGFVACIVAELALLGLATVAMTVRRFSSRE